VSNFRRVLLLTAIPIVALSLISVGGAAQDLESWEPGLYGVWLLAALLFLIALVVAIVFSIRGKRGVAAGVWTGIGIGVVSLGLTCFGIWASWD
jgi:hypothetical protein